MWLPPGTERSMMPSGTNSVAGRLSHTTGQSANFFHCRTPMYQPEAATDGWEEVSGFSARYPST
jgi:hypothetical protein